MHGVNQHHLAAVCGSVAVGPISHSLIVAMEKLNGTLAGEALMACDPAYQLRLSDVAKCLVDITGSADMPSPPGPCREHFVLVLGTAWSYGKGDPKEDMTWVCDYPESWVSWSVLLEHLEMRMRAKDELRDNAMGAEKLSSEPR